MSKTVEQRIQENYGFVVSESERLCRNLFAPSVMDDLIQEGLLGIVRAYEDYDEARGNFLPYARQWIRMRQNRWLSTNLRAVRIPEQHVGSIKFSFSSFDEPNDDGYTLAETMADSRTPFDDFDAANRLERAMELLSEKRRNVLVAFYLNGESDPEIARRLKITRQAVQVMRKRAIEQLQNSGLLRKELGFKDNPKRRFVPPRSGANRNVFKPEQREQTRLCMRRLRAERRGQSLLNFPKRQRRVRAEIQPTLKTIAA